MNNYYQKSLQILNKIEKNIKIDNKKPTLLFHVCCGPCSLYPLIKLRSYFDITVLYDNSNIFPIEERDLRFIELAKIVTKINEKNEGSALVLIKKDYNHDEFIQDLIPFADEKEGSTRCHICYKKRMEAAYEYAEMNNFDYFATSLTSSRQKSSFIINSIGEELSKNHTKTQYFYSDFKKKAWAEIGYQMAKDNEIYLQTYCGCEFSLTKK